MTSNQKGIIYLPTDIYKNPNSFEVIFKHFIPIEAAAVDYGRSIKYSGFSELFREIKEGEKIPTYEFIITKSGLVEALEKYEK